ncbi:hypothetical protein FCV25MIE_03417 [Fagus crenata]
MGWSCGTRAEPLAIGMGDDKGEGGRGDTVHALGAVELPIIEAWSGLAGVRTVAVLQLWLCNVEISENQVCLLPLQNSANGALVLTRIAT